MKTSVLPLTTNPTVSISRLRSRKSDSHLYVVEREEAPSEESFGNALSPQKGTRLGRRLRDALCILLLILLWLAYLLFPLLF